MAEAASPEDLEEIAEGKASSRDMAEAGVHSARAARSALHRLGRGVKVRTRNKTTPPKRKITRRH